MCGIRAQVCSGTLYFISVIAEGQHGLSEYPQDNLIHFWTLWKNLTWLAFIYLLNFGILGQIQLRSWHIASCCRDVINKKHASPEQKHFSSYSVYAKKQSWRQSLWKKIHLSFASKLLLPSASFTNGSNFQLQRALLIYETFLSGFSYFLGILEVFVLHLPTFASKNAMGGRDVQNKA